MHPNPSAYAGTTPSAVGPAKPSRYARVYSGTAPKPVIADEAEPPSQTLSYQQRYRGKVYKLYCRRPAIAAAA